MSLARSRFSDPFDASILMSAARNLRPSAVFALAPTVLLAAVIPAAIEGDIRKPGRFSRISDIKHLLGLPSSYVSAPVIALDRDGLTVLLVLLIGFTFSCAYAQNCALASVFPRLERADILQWRHAPELSLLPRVLRKSVLCRLDTSLSTRAVFSNWLDCRIKKIRRNDPFIAVLSVVLAISFQYVIYRAKSLEVLAPYSQSVSQRASWASLAYRSWWASYGNWPGAISFVLIISFGIYTILLQNSVLMTSVATAAVLRVFAEPKVDWLNTDGHYGWLSVEKVFRASYASIAIRGVTLSVLIIGFGLRNPAISVSVGIIWLAFVLSYHIVPYFMLFLYIEGERSRELDQLVKAATRIRQKGGHELEVKRLFIAEIERVRTAAVNPMRLPKWQFSTFILAVLIPAVLTIIQITF